MLQRVLLRTTRPAPRRVEASTPVADSPEKEKLRDRLLAMILRNEAARKQARR